MAIPEAYINNVGNLTKFLESIRTAGVPDRVTLEFLKTLGFKSTNDRPIITVLKGIGFLDDNGSPTGTYRAFRDHTKGPKVLAKALRTAYADLFLANTKAHELTTDKLRGIIAAKVSKGDVVVKLIASTFKTLAKAADFSEDPSDVAAESEAGKSAATVEEVSDKSGDTKIVIPKHVPSSSTAFHYNIQIHLPTTTDITVYNAIFRSLRENLS
jgi:hypothetical protein